MIVEQSKQIIAEVNKAFMGKKEITEKVLMTIYAEDTFCWRIVPGGKNYSGSSVFKSTWV